MDRHERSELLHAIARAYVTVGIGKRNFDAIPYAEDVVVGALADSRGAGEASAGREHLRAAWSRRYPAGITRPEVVDSHINRDLTVVTVEFRAALPGETGTMRFVERFTVNDTGEIVHQEGGIGPAPGEAGAGWERDGADRP